MPLPRPRECWIRSSAGGDEIAGTPAGAFRAQIGMPPHAYLTHLRIQRAKKLLAEGVRASELAPRVGLYDQSQLTRHFRRIVGMTPARYGNRSVA